MDTFPIPDKCRNCPSLEQLRIIRQKELDEQEVARNNALAAMDSDITITTIHGAEMTEMDQDYAKKVLYKKVADHLDASDEYIKYIDSEAVQRTETCIGTLAMRASKGDREYVTRICTSDTDAPLSDKTASTAHVERTQ